MQTCFCEVRIAGSPLHVVPKGGLKWPDVVTPAEVLILRQIHGEDAVINIRPSKEIKVSHAKEFERLAVRYGGAGALAEPGGAQTLNLHQMFPGAVKTLPLTFAEIGLGVIEEPDEEDEDEEEREAA